MPLTQKSLTLAAILEMALRKWDRGLNKELTPVEIAALMEDAILAEKDGTMSKEDLRATLNDYGDVLKASLLFMIPERK